MLLHELISDPFARSNIAPSLHNTLLSLDLTNWFVPDIVEPFVIVHTNLLYFILSRYPNSVGKLRPLSNVIVFTLSS